MAKKLEEMAEEASDGQLAKTIMESANQIWLAGLGAFAKAQEEGVKMFEALVKDGEKLQKRARDVAGKQMESITARTSEGWEKLEQVFEGRVARALATLNVPTKRDIDTLAERVAKLTEVVDKLAALTEQPPAKTAAREKATEKA
ncbi:MAG TPA: phasin family protein [Acidisphaera sp.]|nr:phasin family protein [Acidisphaera sp.]